MTKPSRRDALKALTAASGALSLAALPDEWTTPVINAGALPPHAQVSLMCWASSSVTGSPIVTQIVEGSNIFLFVQTAFPENTPMTFEFTSAGGGSGSQSNRLTDVNGVALASLTPGGSGAVGTWSYRWLAPGDVEVCTGTFEVLRGPSDRNLKEDISRVDQREVLERLSEVPIATWKYIADGGDVTHMGPMAQDFYAAFGLGEDDRHIFSIDASGVAMAAIQGLFKIVQEKDTQLAQQRTLIEQLDERLAALEAAAGRQNGSSRA